MAEFLFVGILWNRSIAEPLFLEQEICRRLWGWEKVMTQIDGYKTEAVLVFFFMQMEYEVMGISVYVMNIL